MCGSMVDIQFATAEIRRGKKRKKNKLQDKNIMACPLLWAVIIKRLTEQPDEPVPEKNIHPLTYYPKVLYNIFI